VDFEYKQNSRTQIETHTCALMNTTHRHIITERDTLTHINVCISIRINNYEFNVATILSISTHLHPHKAHTHRHTPASLQLTPKKRLQKSIKIKFPALFVNFAAAALQFTAEIEKCRDNFPLSDYPYFKSPAKLNQRTAK